jgi:putative transposase
MTPGFLPGDELVPASSDEPLYEVSDVVARIRRVRVLDLTSNDEKLIDEAELRMQIASGSLRVRRRGVDREQLLHARSTSEDQATQATLEFHFQVLNLMQQYGYSFRRAYIKLVKEVLPEQEKLALKTLSLSQAYRVWNRERNGVAVRLPDANKGRRGPRYDTKVYECIKEKATELFLRTKSRWRMKSLTEDINDQLHEDGVLPKDKKVSRDFVKRVIQTQVNPNPKAARMDAKDAIGAMAVAGQRIRIDGILMRVEQDALHLPWVLRTPYGDTSNVYLVHAIDCATSLIVGWCMVIGSPRVPDTLRCIETILFPKRRRWEDLGLKYDFDVYGTPVMVVVDNGPENKGERLLRLPRLSITLNRLKANHPHEKPYIERLNKSLKEYLETLPGCTRFDGKDGKRDPVAQGDPVMTIEEMERWIVRFYFEHWANHPLGRLVDSIFIDNENLGNTPIRRYRTLVEKLGRPVPLPPSVDTWRSTIYDHETRTLSRKSGIAYADYHFKGDRLSYLISVFGETKVRVLIDPDDFRRVYVVDKDERTLVPLINESTSEVTPAYSYGEAAAVLEEAEAEGIDVAVEALRRDVLSRSVEKAPTQGKGRKGHNSGPAKTSKVEKSKEVAKQARRNEAVKRSSNNPLPPRVSSPGHPPIQTQEDDWMKVTSLNVVDRRTGEVRP